MRLFDTDVLIEHLRGNATGTELVRAAVAEDQGACSVLTRFELLAGMRSAERAAVRGLLDALANVPVTLEIATQAGDWGRRFRRSHAHVGAVDYLIAATADYLDADLLTRNVKHYPMFPGLSPALPPTP